MRTYHSSSSVFMIKIPSGTNRYRKSTEPGSHQTAKIFFIFFRCASSKLLDTLMMFFT